MKNIKMIMSIILLVLGMTLTGCTSNQLTEEQISSLDEYLYRKEEAMNEHHLSGPFSFVIESKGGVIFSSSLSSPIYSNSKSAATHGYMPQRGPRPPFIVSGKRGEKNKRYIGGRLIDEIPTILSLFSLKMEQCGGKVLHGLIIHPQDIDL